jgi:AraC family transcriptional regulator
MVDKILYVRNMVCNRCIKVVKEELMKLDLIVKNIKLGEVELGDKPNVVQLDKIKEVLEENGFGLLDNRKSRIIEKIKALIIQLVHYENQLVLPINISDVLSKELNLEYSYISSLFSSIENLTIEKYFINQKLERVKELLFNDELTLTQIANKMGYSSVQALSNQFKKETGMTPTGFKNVKEIGRRSIDEI